MGSNIVFCTGGNRSGKSALALELASRIPGPKLFVATAEACDPAMAKRIKQHQDARGPEWRCLEVPISKSCRIAELLPLALLPPPYDPQPENGLTAVLVDCLSTWVSACQESWNGAPTDLENGIISAFEDFLDALIKLDIPVFIVSAETGMGVISASAETRQFCDILGAVNQYAAKAASEAFFCVSGLTIKTK